MWLTYVSIVVIIVVVLLEYDWNCIHNALCNYYECATSSNQFYVKWVYPIVFFTYQILMISLLMLILKRLRKMINDADVASKRMVEVLVFHSFTQSEAESFVFGYWTIKRWYVIMYPAIHFDNNDQFRAAMIRKGMLGGQIRRMILNRDVQKMDPYRRIPRYLLLSIIVVVILLIIWMLGVSLDYYFGAKIVVDFFFLDNGLVIICVSVIPLLYYKPWYSFMIVNLYLIFLGLTSVGLDIFILIINQLKGKDESHQEESIAFGIVGIMAMIVVVSERILYFAVSLVAFVLKTFRKYGSKSSTKDRVFQRILSPFWQMIFCMIESLLMFILLMLPHFAIAVQIRFAIVNLLYFEKVMVNVEVCALFNVILFLYQIVLTLILIFRLVSELWKDWKKIFSDKKKQGKRKEEEEDDEMTKQIFDEEKKKIQEIEKKVLEFLVKCIRKYLRGFEANNINRRLKELKEGEDENMVIEISEKEEIEMKEFNENSPLLKN